MLEIPPLLDPTVVSQAELRPVSTQPIARPRRRRLGWLVIGALLAACGIGWLGVGFVSDYLAERRYDAAAAAADRLDPGWRAESLMSRLQAIPDADNSAIRVSEVSDEIRDLTAPPGGIVWQLLQADPTVRLDAEQVASLRSELGTVEGLLANARALAALPAGRFPGARPAVTSLEPVPNSNRARTIPFSRTEDDVLRVAFLLARDAVLRAEAGDCEAAAVSLRAMFNVGRSFGDEPSRLGQEVRWQMTGTAMRSLERVLAQGEVREPVLASFQDLVQDEDAHPGLLTALRGERAALDELFGKVVAGRLSRNAIPGVSNTPVLVRFFFDLGTLRENRVQLLERLNELVEAAKLPEDTQADRMEAVFAGFTHERRNQSELSRVRNSLYDDLLMHTYATASRWRLNLSWRRTALAAIAGERYRRVNGRWPETFDELVPHWLEKVPADPFANGPLRLRRLADGLFVYSVGFDRRDDGGKYQPASSTWTGIDVGFRLWDPGRRRQPAKAAAKNE
jgi:hypothetical protein